jgi:hypothetical protein
VNVDQHKVLTLWFKMQKQMRFEIGNEQTRSFASAS